jgi:hypothetical protein
VGDRDLEAVRFGHAVRCWPVAAEQNHSGRPIASYGLFGRFLAPNTGIVKLLAHPGCRHGISAVIIQARPYTAAANAVVSEMPSHSCQRLK